MQAVKIREIAAEFWSVVGTPEPFPRQLESAVLWTLPLAIIKLPRLWVSEVQSWMNHQGIRFTLGEANDRPLHGCLLAYSGRGCALLNGSDDDAEMRFSLAHEVAHFMLDYLIPRQEASGRLGNEILEVFDGRRAPTVNERVHALFSHINVGFHTHFMERGNDGSLGCTVLGNVEASADHLAIELIAPEFEVRQRVVRFARNKDRQRHPKIATEVLQHEFGLPANVAAAYADRLFSEIGRFRIREWLQQQDG